MSPPISEGAGGISPSISDPISEGAGGIPPPMSSPISEGAGGIPPPMSAGGGGNSDPVSVGGGGNSDPASGVVGVLRVGSAIGAGASGVLVAFFLVFFNMNFFFCSPISEIPSSFSWSSFNSLAIKFIRLRA